MPEGNSLDSPVRLLGQLLAGKEVSREPDWEVLLALASRYRLSPMLYWQSQQRGIGSTGTVHKGASGSEGCWAGIPAVVWERLRQDHFTATAQTVVVERQLAQVLEVLRLADVPAVVLKGAALAAFYPVPALRTYKDLDLLVPEADLDRAEEAVRRLGYHSLKSKEWALAQHYHLPPMKGAGLQLDVEIHWRLDEPQESARLPVDDLWRRARPWAVAGQQTLRLEEVDSALHLCQHAVMQHRGRQGPRPVCDLAQVVRGWQSVQWQGLVHRALDYGLGPAVYLMLTLMNQLLGTAAPPTVMETLRPAGSELLPEDLLERLLPVEESLAAHVPMALLRAESKGTVLAGAKHLISRLVPPREAMAAMYGVPVDSARIWLMFLWRPVDLLRQYGVAAWGVLWGSRAARAAWQREAWLERWLAQADPARGPDQRSV